MPAVNATTSYRVFLKSVFFARHICLKNTASRAGKIPTRACTNVLLSATKLSAGTANEHAWRFSQTSACRNHASILTSRRIGCCWNRPRFCLPPVRLEPLYGIFWKSWANSTGRTARTLPGYSSRTAFRLPHRSGVHSAFAPRAAGPAALSKGFCPFGMATRRPSPCLYTGR